MEKRQEFLVLESEGNVAVYAPSDFPIGTPIGRDAQRMGVSGPTRVRPPRARLTRLEFDRWRDEIEHAGFRVTLEAFWTNPRALVESEGEIRRGNYRSLEDVRDELLRQADGRSGEEAQRMAPVKSPYS
jgi:hypothetical protein